MSLMQMTRPIAIQPIGGFSRDQTSDPAPANAFWTIGSDGTITGSSHSVDIIWLQPGVYSQQFWVRATLNSGLSNHFTQGTFNTWQQLNTNRTWNLNNPNNNTQREAQVLFEFAYDSTGTNRVPNSNSTVDFTATMGLVA